VMWTGYMARF